MGQGCSGGSIARAPGGASGNSAASGGDANATSGGSGQNQAGSSGVNVGGVSSAGSGANGAGGSLACTAGAAKPPVSKYIVVDQFGYLPDGEKVAVIRDPQTGFDAAASFTRARATRW